MNIIISKNNNETILTLPFVPAELGIGRAMNNTEFDTTSGIRLNIIGKEELRTLSIDSILLNGERYKNEIKGGASTNAYDYIIFFNSIISDKIPMRIIITEGETVLLNMACTVESFSYTPVKSSDMIRYTVELKEYNFIAFNKVKI